MKNIIDLHSHSTKSDGSYTPNDLLKYAEEKGLKYLSITDHESVEAYYDMDRSLFSGSLIPGIELRTTCCGVSIELLGYGFDVDKMREAIKKYHFMTMSELNLYIITHANLRYRKLGIILDDDFVDKFNVTEYPKVSYYILKEIEKHPENKKLLGTLAPGQSFFRTHLTNPNSIFFIDLSEAFPTPDELIKVIRDCNGIVSIPHIYQYNENSNKILSTLLANYDIDAIECFYPLFTEEQTQSVLNIAKEHHKFISGGSDFHGDYRPWIDLATGKNNNLNIDQSYLNDWYKNLNTIL